MGMDLGRGVSLNWHMWCYCLETAESYGWNPKGTELTFCPYGGEITAEEKRAWNGTYFSNDFQVVTDEDARALAQALRFAIAIEGESYNSKPLATLEAHAAQGSFAIG